MTKNPFLQAAIAGLIGASAMAAGSAFAATAENGHCMGANSCKGKGSCSIPGKNGCEGQNACKGKSYIETTKAKCQTLAKKNKKIKWVADADADAGGSKKQ